MPRKKRENLLQAVKKRENVLQTIEELRWDLWLAVVTIGLVIFGVVMVYSAAAAANQPHKYLFGQMIWAVLGLVVMALMRRIDYHSYAQPGVVYGFLGLCVLLLLLVFLFPAINGAHRWLTLKGMSAQPSELAKIALVFFLAWFLSERERDGELGDFWATVAPACVVMGILAALILREPDLGTTLVLGIVFLAMMIGAGAQMKHLLWLAPFLLTGAVWMVVKVAWRLERIKTFFDPERDPLGKGYQVLQSLIAVGSGGFNGLGFGQSRQKLSFLIAPQSDFIFAVVAEELGFTGATTLVLAYGLFLWRGIRISGRAPDRLGELIAVGLTIGLVAQAFFNISVALNILPAKGITLPFVSAGGSSLVVALAAVGIMLNISEQGSESRK
ncbi:MAG TPA: putative peptidoglycan glycosyltransferase FtsW [Blastocatellia bacterium]|nr:putative peptidoglycan glycosyltransferase FtsW [Blastocatellia bacterium]